MPQPVHFTGSKLSLLLAGRCVLGGGQSGAQGPVMCGAGLTGGVGTVGLVAGQRLGQGAWVVCTGRCGFLRWAELLGAGLAAVALIGKLARMDILTTRVGRGTG